MPDINVNEDEISALSTFLGAEPRVACPTTQLTLQLPALIAPGSPYDDHFWYGSTGLWTLLRSDAEWNDLPHSERGYGQKILWWREGYNWREDPQPNLTVTDRRLDDSAPTLIASPATNGCLPELGSFMLVGAEIPTAGCWEITGFYVLGD